VRAALRNEPLTVYGDGKQTRCFAFVGDVVPALIELMDRSDLNGEIYNIGSTERITIVELAKQIVSRTGSPSDITFVPYDKAFGPGYEDMRHRAPCLEKIGAAIGFKPTTALDTILDSVIAEMRKHPGIEV
jgi:UDP-glucose 4-epimerase